MRHSLLCALLVVCVLLCCHGARAELRAGARPLAVATATHSRGRSVQVRFINANYELGAVDVYLDDVQLEAIVQPMERVQFATVYRRRDWPRGGEAELRVTAADAPDDVLGRATLRGFVDGVYHSVAFARRGGVFCARVFRDTGRAAPAALPPASKAVALAYHLGCGNDDAALTALLEKSIVWAGLESMGVGAPRQFAAGRYTYDALLYGARNDSGGKMLLAESNGGVEFSYDFAGGAIYRIYFGRTGSTTPVAAIERAYSAEQPIPDDVALEPAPVAVLTFGQQFKAWFVDNPGLSGVLVGGLCLVFCVVAVFAFLYKKRMRRKERDDFEW